MRLRYAGDDWVFADQFLLALGDRRFTFEAGIMDVDRDVVLGGVIETATFDITDRPDLIAELLKESTPQTVRFIGRERYTDVNVGAAIGPARVVVSVFYMKHR
jgi:hypothetical protein